jgi:hypothetical protein
MLVFSPIIKVKENGLIRCAGLRLEVFFKKIQICFEKNFVSLRLRVFVSKKCCKHFIIALSSLCVSTPEPFD